MLIAASLVSLLYGVALVHGSGGNCVCGPNGATCDELTATWTRLHNDRYWAYVSPCSGSCSQLPSDEQLAAQPERYFGWRRATPEEWLLAPINKNYWCVYDGNGNNPEFFMNNGDICSRHSGTQPFCSAKIFDPVHNHCDPTNRFVRVEDNSYNELMFIHDCIAFNCDEDSCDACWPDDEGNGVDGVCPEIATIRGICKNEYVARRCPTECGYCQADENGDYSYCALTKSFEASPLEGPVCGGAYVYVTSPCFTNTKRHKVACLFGYSYVEGVRFNSTHYMCVAPPNAPRNGPLQVDFKVKFGGKYFSDVKTFTYIDQCYGALAGAAGDPTLYVVDGEPLNIQWDENAISSDRVVIFRDRWFSDSFAGNFQREIIDIVENNGLNPIIIGPSYFNERGRQQVSSRYSVGALSGDLEAQYNAGDLDDGEYLPRSNMRMHWADHEDIASTATAQDMWTLYQRSKVYAASQLGREADMRQPEFRGGAGASAEAYALCTWGCTAKVQFGKDAAQAMTSVYIKYQECGDDRDFARFNLREGFHFINSGDDWDMDDCAMACEGRLINGTGLCTLVPVKTCSDNVIDAARCIQLNEEVFDDEIVDAQKPLKCIRRAGWECPCDAADGNGGGASGDPHWITWDSNKQYLYHYQGAGVFYAIRGPGERLGFEGQLLTRKRSSGATVSYVYGMAWKKYGEPAIAIEYGDSYQWYAWWNDMEIDLTNPDDVRRVNDESSYFEMVFQSNTVEIQFDFGLWVSYKYSLHFMSRPNCALKDTVHGGLLGKYDGQVANDLINTDFVTYRADLNDYADWGDQWRVECADSLFPRHQSGSACGAINRRRLQDQCDEDDLFQVCGDPVGDFGAAFDRFIYPARDRQKAGELCDPWDRNDIGIQWCWQDYLESLDEISAQIKENIKDFEAAIDPPIPEFVCSPVCMNGGICVANGECQCIGPYSGDYCQDPDREWQPTQGPTQSPSPGPTNSPTKSPTPCAVYPETCSEALCYNGRGSGAKDCSAAPPGVTPFIVVPPAQYQVGIPLDGCNTVQCRHCGDVEKCVKTCKDYRKVNGIPIKGTFSCVDLCAGPGVPYVCFYDGGTMECPPKCNGKQCRDLLFPEKHECSSINRDIVDPLNCYDRDNCGYGSVTCDMCGTGAQVKAKCEQFKVDNAGIPEVDAIDCRAEANAVGPGYKCFAGCLPP